MQPNSLLDIDLSTNCQQLCNTLQQSSFHIANLHHPADPQVDYDLNSWTSPAHHQATTNPPPTAAAIAQSADSAGPAPSPSSPIAPPAPACPPPVRPQSAADPRGYLQTTLANYCGCGGGADSTGGARRGGGVEMDWKGSERNWSVGRRNSGGNWRSRDEGIRAFRLYCACARRVGVLEG